MSKLASKLTSAPPTGARAVKRGPDNRCGPIYEADAEDAAAIAVFRARPGESWATAQTRWDELLGIDPSRRIPNDKFRYHWRRRCYCWPDDLRLS